MVKAGSVLWRICCCLSPVHRPAGLLLTHLRRQRLYVVLHRKGQTHSNFQVQCCCLLSLTRWTPQKINAPNYTAVLSCLLCSSFLFRGSITKGSTLNKLTFVETIFHFSASIFHTRCFYLRCCLRFSSLSSGF